MNVNALVKMLGRAMVTAGVYRLLRKLGAPAIVGVIIIGAIAYMVSAK